MRAFYKINPAAREAKLKNLRDWYRNNPQKKVLYAQRKKERREIDPVYRERVRRQGRAGLLKWKWGMTMEELSVALATGCHICGRPIGKVRQDYAIDHDHVTGVKRGFLCQPCNKGLGCYFDNPDLLIKAANYLSGAKSQLAQKEKQ